MRTLTLSLVALSLSLSLHLHLSSGNVLYLRTYPEEEAPRTGDGLFPGEVIEVTQVSDLIKGYRSSFYETQGVRIWKDNI